MFSQIRRQDRQLSESDTQEILTNGIYGVLSLNGSEDEYAYGIPVTYVYNGNSIFIHCALEGKKLDRINKNNKVSFCVVGKSNPLPDKFSIEYSSAIVFGTANIVNDSEKLDVLIEFVKKYSAQYLDKGIEYAQSAQHKCLIIKIDCQKITGKARNI